MNKAFVNSESLAVASDGVNCLGAENVKSVSCNFRAKKTCVRMFFLYLQELLC